MLNVAFRIFAQVPKNCLARTTWELQEVVSYENGKETSISIKYGEILVYLRQH
jgi:hypothetical protein